MQLTTTSPSGVCGGVHAGGAGVFERPRYFPRQLMTPDELTLEADYFRDRMRRHNLYLHGWGVVCGALVCNIPAPAKEAEDPPAQQYKPWVVRVKPGYVLGPQGDEIVVDGCDVSLRGPAASDSDDCGCDDAGDPWCTEVFDAKVPEMRYVAVRYRQVQTRPVRAQPGGCGCDETPCEYSRFRDSYECGVLDAPPASHVPKADPQPDAKPVNPPCPAPVESPWVVLAVVTLDPTTGAILTIDNCSKRRIVSSARDAWFNCAGAAPEETFPPAAPAKAPVKGGPAPKPSP